MQINSKDGKYIPHLLDKYNSSVRSELKHKLNVENDCLIPRIKNIYIASCISNTKHSTELLKKIYDSLYIMSGNKPVYTVSRKSINQFKIYKGTKIGCMVCLTGVMMYEFIDRLIRYYMPNIKNFRGIKMSSINRKSISMGIEDANIIKEVSKHIGLSNFGFTITINFNVDDKEGIYQLLHKLDFPIYK